ncbi:C-type mannose receptor 2-like [Diadema setosum]|uniref:C-type mannose receptor 2-like n=1 Tax=Diadema setosum TaxID=31175 RepID=UPI003B3A8B7E
MVQAKSCNELGKIENGDVATTDGVVLNSKATYSCDDGYQLKGSNTRTCSLPNGNSDTPSWSGSAPSCESLGFSDTEPSCRRGYQLVGRSCYKFVDEKATWEEQEKICRKDRGSLALPNSRFQDLALQVFIERNAGHSQKYIWIGAQAIVSGSFQTARQKQLPFKGWARGRPRDVGSNRDVYDNACAYAKVDGSGWDNECCFTELAAVCETTPENLPAPRKCPPGYTAVLNNCFKYLDKDDTFEGQCKACKDSHGGRLVEIPSRAKNDLVNLFIKLSSSKDVEVWINVQDEIQEGFWQTIDRKCLGFYNWGTNEPNEGGHANCGRIKSRDGFWYDRCCFYKFKAVCEIPGPDRPTKDVKCPKGYTAEGNHCFRYAPKADSFEAQCTACKRAGGELAKLNSEESNNAAYCFIGRTTGFIGHDHDEVWVALTDEIHEGTWRTIDRERYDYTHWGRGDPNGKDHSNCGRMKKDGWRDNCCFNENPALCQADPL